MERTRMKGPLPHLVQVIETHRILALDIIYLALLPSHFSACSMKGSVVVAAEKGDLEELKKLIEEENYCVDSRGGKEKYVHNLFFKQK